jgi:hypothetical protein
MLNGTGRSLSSGPKVKVTLLSILKSSSAKKRGCL